jgi:hypothetical protein
MFKRFIKPSVIMFLCFLLVLLVANGQMPSSRDVDLDNGEEHIRILGDDTSDWSGYSVSSGDINGDGYADIIIGAGGADTSGGIETGETYVIFGSAAPLSTIDLNNSPSAADMIIYGDDSYDRFGYSVSSGDINGDGYDDIIIGAPYASPAGGTEAGETYVIFGSAAPPATVDLNSTSADITIYGDDAYDYSGSFVSSGDINGDGYADIIIGARGADPAGGIEAGETYVIFGSAAPPASVDLNSTSADITIYGDDAYGDLGWSVSSGDTNGDGYADIIIGAYQANPAGGADAGETYVIFGSAAPPATIDLNSTSADMTISGDDAADYSGYSVSSGDINGDGFDDVIIGARGADPAGGNSAGETYVIFGSAALPATVDLNSYSADMTISGDDANDESGSSVYSGDINGDGYDDIIIGARGADPAGGNQAGETYVIYGGTSLTATVDLNFASADMTIYGDDASDYSGYSVSSGDVNGDGYDDVIIGTPYANPAGGLSAGETYVIFGSGIPVFYDFFDTDISDWQRKGTGVAKVIDEQLMLRRTSSNFRLFPKGASAEKCTIEAKVTRVGGNLAKVSSSIFFSFEDNRNFWELKMELYSKNSKKTGKWLLQHKKDGMFVEQHNIVDILNRNQQYLIKVEVGEEQIIVKVDDVEKINIFLRGDVPTWGKIALSNAGAGKSLFDDLKVY